MQTQSLFDKAIEAIRGYSVDPQSPSQSSRSIINMDPTPHEDGSVSWAPQPKQALAMAQTTDEIYYGGARGGGKTHCQTYWVVKPCIERYNGRYKYNNYRAAVVRVQYVDLEDWINTATEIYGPLGGKAKGRPVVFEFPSNCQVTTGHLGDRGGDANTKYQGHNIHAIAIDEANQIESRKVYLKLLGSLRGSPTGLSQAFLTGNPGGIGDPWIKERFIDIKHNGIRIPPGTPFIDPATGMSRVFIQAQLRDNPKLLNKDPRYLLKLLGQDEVTRRQWLHGDWDVSPGTFFTEFRKTRSAFEPPHAYHTVHSSRVSIKPWFRKWISIDWGHSDYTAVYWYCQNEKGRVYVYREYIARRVGSFQLGVDIARQSLEDLPDANDYIMEAYVSPDLFNKNDQGNTRISELERGINSVLGFGGAVAMGYDTDEKELAERDPAKAYQQYTMRTIGTLATARIVLKMANNRRVEGLMWMREMFRWRTIDNQDELKAKYETLLKSSDRRSQRLAKNYEIQLRADTVMPKCRILSDRCPRLIQTIVQCRFDDNKPNEMVEFVGDDPVDSLRYGLMGFRDMPAELPRRFVIAAAIDQAMEQQKKSGVIDRFGLQMKYIAAQRNYERERARAELEEIEDMETAMEMEELTVHELERGVEGGGMGLYL